MKSAAAVAIVALVVGASTLVQAAPTGFSAFVSPDGEVHQRTSVSVQAVITQAVTLRSGSTWYRSVGDLPWALLALSALIGCRVAARRARAATAATRTTRATAPTTGGRSGA